MMYRFEALENRRLFTTVYPSASEQYELELINRARANPAAEAARLHVALNEGLPAGTISTSAKQPLAFNPNLVDAARRHSAWMLSNNLFSHTGANGSDPGVRMRTSGYAFSGSWTWGENIAYRSSSSALDQAPTAAKLHADLFVDQNVAGRGHRTNLMSDSFREIGVGLVDGTFRSMNAQMLTEDFATSGEGAFLTGVAYADTKTKDNFYTPGEALANVAVSARRVSDDETFTTSTWSSGGYALKLSPGIYTITAVGGDLSSATVIYRDVVIGTTNVKRDFRPDYASAGPVPTGSIRGTVFDDRDRDGFLDDGEYGIAGVLVYIDANSNGRRDGGEHYARTNADGAYRLSGLADAKYTVRQQLVSGAAPSSPIDGYFRVKILNGKAVAGRNFANMPI